MKMRTQHGLAGLPGELMFDIFYRLPVRDLLRCRLVCKDWRKFMLDPLFVNSHHSRLIQTLPSASHPDFILVDRLYWYSDNLFLLENGKPNPIWKPLHRDLQFYLYGKFNIVGSSHGLVCLYFKFRQIFSILNPITKEILHLPKPPHLPAEYKSVTCGPAPPGFAFDASSNTYKIFSTWHFFDRQLREVRTGVEIYSFGVGKKRTRSSSSWTRIHDIPVELFFHTDTSSTSLFLHGAIHCLTHLPLHTVGALNVATHEFHSFEMPPWTLKTRSRSLGTMSDSLCFIEQFEDTSITVWTMKEYGVIGSWTKDYVLKKQTLGPLQGTSFHCFMAAPFKNICGRKNIVFLGTGKDKGYYDFDTGEFEPIQIDESPDDPVHVLLHVATLISPRTLTPTLATGSRRITRSMSRRKLV